MAPPIKRRGRKTPSQCRFKVPQPEDLHRYKQIALRYGYMTVSDFLRAVMSAAETGNPATGEITVEIKFRPVGVGVAA